jgi:hypothetical protein
MFMLFHLFKTCIKNHSLLFILFSPSYQSRNNDANREPHAYIYALEIVFSQIAKTC